MSTKLRLVFVHNNECHDVDFDNQQATINDLRKQLLEIQPYVFLRSEFYHEYPPVQQLNGTKNLSEINPTARITLFVRFHLTCSEENCDGCAFYYLNAEKYVLEQRKKEIKAHQNIKEKSVLHRTAFSKRSTNGILDIFSTPQQACDHAKKQADVISQICSELQKHTPNEIEKAKYLHEESKKLLNIWIQIKSRIRQADRSRVSDRVKVIKDLIAFRQTNQIGPKEIDKEAHHALKQVIKEGVKESQLLCARVLDGQGSAIKPDRMKALDDLIVELQNGPARASRSTDKRINHACTTHTSNSSSSLVPQVKPVFPQIEDEVVIEVDGTSISEHEALLADHHSSSSLNIISDFQQDKPTSFSYDSQDSPIDIINVSRNIDNVQSNLMRINVRVIMDPFVQSDQSWSLLDRFSISVSKTDKVDVLYQIVVAKMRSQKIMGMDSFMTIGINLWRPGMIYPVNIETDKTFEEQRISENDTIIATCDERIYATLDSDTKTYGYEHLDISDNSIQDINFGMSYCCSILQFRYNVKAINTCYIESSSLKKACIFFTVLASIFTLAALDSWLLVAPPFCNKNEKDCEFQLVWKYVNYSFLGLIFGGFCVLFLCIARRSQLSTSGYSASNEWERDRIQRSYYSDQYNRSLEYDRNLDNLRHEQRRTNNYYHQLQNNYYADQWQRSTQTRLNNQAIQQQNLRFQDQWPRKW